LLHILSNIFISLHGVFCKTANYNIVKKDEGRYLKLLGEEISRRRKSAMLTKKALADKTKLTRMHIYRIENGEHAASITILRRIAAALDTSLSDLVNVK
jgi:DNA-binding XRE family transcriptional regulator